MLRAAVLAVMTFASGAAHAQKPPVPPGIDPGGLAVAVIGPGVDYRRSDVARRLARDGEGELIGWDLALNDRRPFAPSDVPKGDRTAISGPARAIRIVPVRAEPISPAMVSSGLAFAVQTPAQVAVIRAGALRSDMLAMLVQVAPRASRLLIIIDGDAPDTPALPDNVLAVVARPGEPSGADPVLEELLGRAPAWLVTSIACDDAMRRLATGAELKAALLARSGTGRGGSAGGPERGSCS